MPGMLCDAGLWAEVEPMLDVSPVHAQVDAPSITGMAEQVLSAVDGPFVLVGLSLGAIVGFEVARLAPDRIAGFAAMSTNAAAPRDDQHRGWRRMSERAACGEFAAVVEDVLPTMYAAPRPRPGLARAFREMAQRVGAERLRTQLAAQATRTDVRSALGSITAPALVVGGTRDALCPPEFHREIADQFAGAELHVVPDAGHLLPLEAPAAVAALVNRLIGRCRGWS